MKYVVLALIAIVLYKFGIGDNHYVKKIGRSELTFNGMVTSLVIYFIGLTAYIYFII